MKKFRTALALLLALLSLSAVMTVMAATPARRTTRANAVVLPPRPVVTAPASNSTYNASPASATSGAVR